MTIKLQQPTRDRPSLETRVADRKLELIAELIEHKKRTGSSASDAVDALKRRLTQLDDLIKTYVVNGWRALDQSRHAEFELWIDR